MDCGLTLPFDSDETVFVVSDSNVAAHEFSCQRSFGDNRIFFPSASCSTADIQMLDESDEIRVLLTDTRRFHSEWGEQFATKSIGLLDMSKEESEQPPQISSLKLVIEAIDALRPSKCPDVSLEYDGSMYVGWRSPDRKQFLSMVAKLNGLLEYAYRTNERIGSGHCSIGDILTNIPKDARHPMHG